MINCFSFERYYLRFFAAIMSLIFSSLLPSMVHSEDSSTHEKLIDFNKIEISAFEEVRFNNETKYQIIQFEDDKVLRAESQASASGLLLKKQVALNKTPYLNWRWRIEKRLPELAETTKSGDDYAARIYLIHSDGWFFWQTKALNYVWSSRKVKEQSWPNAYAPDNAMMKALRGQADESGTWFTEKRHVANDFKAWLGENVAQIDGLAIMTDTDDSQGHAIVYYGNIYFSKD